MKERIALVVNTLSGGGAEKTAANLSRMLSKQFAVDIIVNDDVHLQYEYEGRVIPLGMPADKDRMGIAYQIRALVRRTRLLRKLKEKRNYKAVLSFSEMTNLANVLSGGNTVISVHNSVKNSRASGWKHWLVAEVVFPYCFRRTGKVVACSKGVNDELMREYGLPSEKGKVIYNGLELRTIRKKAKEPLDEYVKEKLYEKKVFVSVGRLIRSKGHRFLLNAVKILKDEGVPVHLIILGEGGERASLEAQAFKLGIADDISMPGFVMNPYAYIARADAVVMPSLHEGFGIAVVEALACGAPVISTDYEAGAREILAPDTDYRVKTGDKVEEAKYGILVPVCKSDENDSHAGKPSKEEVLMADAMRKILEDKALARYYRKASLERAKQLEIRSTCEQWIETIEG